MKAGDPVKVTGCRDGLTDRFVGRVGVIVDESNGEGFWMVRLDGDDCDRIFFRGELTVIEEAGKEMDKPKTIYEQLMELAEWLDSNSHAYAFLELPSVANAMISKAAEVRAMAEQAKQMDEDIATLYDVLNHAPLNEQKG